ncbi:hypothetical protein BF49_1251 [Bradyrhizobium sp.]|nr:hypothetical protein BF49_1251 [Bradyrhizobium sp.]
MLTIRHRAHPITQGRARETVGCAAAMFGEPDRTALFLTEQANLRAASQP